MSHWAGPPTGLSSLGGRGPSYCAVRATARDAPVSVSRPSGMGTRTLDAGHNGASASHTSLGSPALRRVYWALSFINTRVAGLSVTQNVLSAARAHSHAVSAGVVGVPGRSAKGRP